MSPKPLALAAALLVAACASAPKIPPIWPPSDPDAIPGFPRELRGVWVASVSNIDWPSRPGLPVAEQKAELLAILDRARELGLNAVILQVRPAGDALYASELEPWSEYLTGEQGKPPEPYYDPLTFAVEEAHRRGLELHAWFNPYRARHPSARSPQAPTHLSVQRPDLVRTFGTHLWMDPGEPDVLDHGVRVALDVVRRYDIDGIHIDDYFYPYREYAPGQDFPDEPSWTRYVQAGGKLARDDWRRRNVDLYVERVYRETKRLKPWVRFGVSPIGTWRPGNPWQVRGFDATTQIYADSRKWLNEGWLDYFVPQLYQLLYRPDASSAVLLGWWAQQNLRDRHLYVGLIPNRVGDPERGDWPPSEILSQVYVTRGHPGADGHVHFSMRTLMPPRASTAGPPADSVARQRQTAQLRRDSLNAMLQVQAYSHPALVPASPWLGGRAPDRPRVRLAGDTGSAATSLALEPGGGASPWLWAVRWRANGVWRLAVVPGAERNFAIPADPSGRPPDLVGVSGVSRTGREGPVAVARP